MKRPRTIIFRLVSERSPIFLRLEIPRQSCLSGDFWGTGLPCGCPGRGRDKAFRNLAPAAAVIPGWPVNPGLCSSRAIAAWLPEFPATSPFSCAISAPVGQSNFFGCQSLPGTVARPRRKSVFTRTHDWHAIVTLFRLKLTGLSNKCVRERQSNSRANRKHEAMRRVGFHPSPAEAAAESTTARHFQHLNKFNTTTAELKL